MPDSADGGSHDNIYRLEETMSETAEIEIEHN